MNKNFYCICGCPLSMHQWYGRDAPSGCSKRDESNYIHTACKIYKPDNLRYLESLLKEE